MDTTRVVDDEWLRELGALVLRGRPRVANDNDSLTEPAEFCIVLKETPYPDVAALVRVIAGQRDRIDLSNASADAFAAARPAHHDARPRLALQSLYRSQQ